VTNNFLLHFNWHQNNNWAYYLHKKTYSGLLGGASWGRPWVCSVCTNIFCTHYRDGFL